MFEVGELVALQSDPDVLMPVIQVISAGAEYRYRVFQNNSKTIYYESQLQKAALPADDHKAVTVQELHAHLTSLQILCPLLRISSRCVLAASSSFPTSIFPS